MVVRPHRSLQVHRLTRWHVQHRIGLWDDGRTLVSGMGIKRSAMETTRALSEVFASPFRRQIQDTDAGGTWPKRLPPRCQRRFSALHYTATAEGAVQNVVFPRRRAL